MTEASREQKLSSTHIPTPEDKIIKSELISPESEKSYTSSKSHQKGQTAPSTSANGSVWLRYVPRERKEDVSDTT